MKILFTCGREPEYVRNQVLLRALRRHYEIIEVTDHRSGSLIARNLRLFPRLLRALCRRNYDLVFVGFYGYLIVIWLRLMTRSPIIFDAFVSNYDTLCFDRQQFRPGSIMGKLAYLLDKIACTAGDLILLDTAAHQKYFIETFNIDPDKTAHVFVSCSEELFFPRTRRLEDDRFRIFYYSSYMPLHGVEYIIKCAKILEAHKDIQFIIIGDGPTYKSNFQLAKQLNIKNIKFEPYCPYLELPAEINKADLCLAGPFGQTSKARRIIPGKLFQFLAMGQPTIAADTPANRELLEHRYNSFLVPNANAQALAEAILEIRDDPDLRLSIAATGRKLYLQTASEQKIGRELSRIIEKIGQTGKK